MNEVKLFRVDGSSDFTLSNHRTDFTGNNDSKEKAIKKMKLNSIEMIKEQSKLYSSGEYSVLIIFQGMDASGKDSAIRRVMSGLNPQGTTVSSFKQPSPEELRHDYLWRMVNRLPERGQIGIFNRSYYEEVLVAKVHNLVESEKIPEELLTDVWNKRYEQIKNFEKYLTENGTVIIKLFLNISKEEQKKRLLGRIKNTSKNWKFSDSDIKERRYWQEYLRCYEAAINNTSTPYAPWYVIPSDKKWYSRLVISQIITDKLKSLNLEFPRLDEDKTRVLQKYRKVLENS